jgi:hypothetical protein
MVGVIRLELTTSASRTLRASQLRHTPIAPILTDKGVNENRSTALDRFSLVWLTSVATQ